MELTILYIIIAIVIINFFISRILEHLNLKTWKAVLPENLKSFFDETEYVKSREYHKANSELGILSESFSFLLIIIVLVTGVFGWLDDYLRNYISNPIFLALAFFGVLFIISEILNLPFSLYKTFKIEEKFGFNKMTPFMLFTDKLKAYMLTLILGGGLTALILWIVFETGNLFWLFGWVTVIVFSLFMNFFYTSLILPLFNKLTPLDDGELRQTIENYASKVKFPLKNIFVIDGSKRSTKSNAFFSGFGSKKKIVLYDTLMEKHDNDELLAILAHEAGHYKKNHIYIQMFLSILMTGIMFFLLSLIIFNEQVSFALGASQLSVHINLIAFAILYEPVSMITGLLFNIISRKNEFEADAFAVSTTNDKEPIKNALIRLSKNNLSNLHPHPAYVFFNYSHPPLLKRLNAIDNIKMKKPVEYEKA